MAGMMSPGRYSPRTSYNGLGGSSYGGTSPIYANGYVNPRTPGAVQVPVRSSAANGLPAYRMPVQPQYTPFTPSAQPTPTTNPVDYMRRRTTTTSTTTEPRQGYEDLTMNDFRSALGGLGSEIPDAQMPGRVKRLEMADRTAAEDAAFGRAKDRVGEASRAGLNDLADEMSARGIGGSGLEGALTTGILNAGQGQLGEVNREQAIDRMKRADEISNLNYQGDLSQRSQDMNWLSTQRGQNIGQRGDRLSNAMRLMELLRRSRTGMATNTSTNTTTQETR